MDKDRREALEWFIQFTQMDLKDFKPGNRAKFLAEYEEYLLPDIREERERLKKEMKYYMQKEGKEGTGYIFEAFFSYPSKKLIHMDETSFWNFMKDVQFIVRSIFLKVAEPNYIIPKSPALGSTGPTGIWYQEARCYLDINKNPMQLVFVPIKEIWLDYLLIKLYTLLSGFPRTTIQKCLGCDKLFLNPSLRIKKFCSSRCLWRFNARKRREADPEGYKEKQREIMKARYLRKTAEELEKPIDKIKIQKRRTKKQED
jgi:hypothetical protein